MLIPRACGRIFRTRSFFQIIGAQRSRPPSGRRGSAQQSRTSRARAVLDRLVQHDRAPGLASGRVGAVEPDAAPPRRDARVARAIEAVEVAVTDATPAPCRAARRARRRSFSRNPRTTPDWYDSRSRPLRTRASRRFSRHSRSAVASRNAWTWLAISTFARVPAISKTAPCLPRRGRYTGTRITLTKKYSLSRPRISASTRVARAAADPRDAARSYARARGRACSMLWRSISSCACASRSRPRAGSRCRRARAACGSARARDRPRGHRRWPARRAGCARVDPALRAHPLERLAVRGLVAHAEHLVDELMRHLVLEHAHHLGPRPVEHQRTRQLERARRGESTGRAAASFGEHDHRRLEPAAKRKFSHSYLATSSRSSAASSSADNRAGSLVASVQRAAGRVAADSPAGVRVQTLRSCVARAEP